jgi:hypothetical protein
MRGQNFGELWQTIASSTSTLTPNKHGCFVRSVAEH